MSEDLEQSVVLEPQDLPEQWRTMSRAGKLVVGGIVVCSLAGAGALIYNVPGAIAGACYGIFCAVGTEFNSRMQR
ncbi:hypothetical protein FJZ17_00375 [Candidatus Pacearchaeota archaeon]|nr:hypothetical protein [Candidatus Pacearchaeota archaeon]